MQKENLIEKCLQVLGGKTQLTSIFSLYCQIERSLYLSDQLLEKYKINVYRAQGGRIRFEKYHAEKTMITILNDMVGKQKTLPITENKSLTSFSDLDVSEIMAIKRSVRLYPRNFLAHIDEYQQDFQGLKFVNNFSSYVLDSSSLSATYYFDPTFFLCLGLLDKQTNIYTYYNNYQNINNIPTPLEEKSLLPNNILQIDSISKLEYNLEIDKDLFNFI